MSLLAWVCVYVWPLLEMFLFTHAHTHTHTHNTRTHTYTHLSTHSRDPMYLPSRDADAMRAKQKAAAEKKAAEGVKK